MRVVEEYNEFTWDMVRALPKAYFLKHKYGNVEVHCKPNISSIYYFADEIIEQNKFNGVNDLTTYSKEGPEWIKTEWLPPPLKKYFKEKSKEVFKELKIKFTKPTVVIQNKYTEEWGCPPANFISIEDLDTIITQLKPVYDIIYFRPDSSSKNYYTDCNELQSFDDYKMIKEKHPSVICARDYSYDFNILQFCLESTADKHIAVAGGNACVSAYFGGEVIIFQTAAGPNPTDEFRPIWLTDSWLGKLSNAKITGFLDGKNMVSYIKANWL
jgi:hypothetical protein